MPPVPDVAFDLELDHGRCVGIRLPEDAAEVEVLAGLLVPEERAFAEGFDESEPQAYGRLLKDLMDNSSLLVSGGLMSAKEVLDKMQDLQLHIKKGGTGGRSMPDLFHDWFNEEST